MAVFYNGKYFNDMVVEDSRFTTGIAIYEVIRIFNSLTVFLDDNTNRLIESLKRSNIDIEFHRDQFREKIEQFVTLNNIVDGNIKYILHKSENGIVDEYIYQIPHKYPSKEQYRLGVSTSILNAERSNPEIKYLNVSFREYTNSIIAERNVYELLLVNENGFITEGSKSNIFFIKNGTIYTSPNEMVLGGTARNRVIKLAQELGIQVVMQAVQVAELTQYNSAFITGTSPLILPIANVDDIGFDVNNNTLRRLMESYFKLMHQ